MDRGPTCRELVELVTDHLEGALPERERVRFEAHVAACEGCDAHVEQVRRAIELTGRTRALEQGPEIAALRSMFREYRRARL